MQIDYEFSRTAIGPTQRGCSVVRNGAGFGRMAGPRQVEAVRARETAPDQGEPEMSHECLYRGRSRRRRRSGWAVLFHIATIDSPPSATHPRHRNEQLSSWRRTRRTFPARDTTFTATIRARIRQSRSAHRVSMQSGITDGVKSLDRNFAPSLRLFRVDCSEDTSRHRFQRIRDFKRLAKPHINARRDAHVFGQPYPRHLAVA